MVLIITKINGIEGSVNMGKRNLALSEKKEVLAADPDINIDEWILYKKYPTYYVLRHKFNREKKKVDIA